ncbi:MAG: hypothetical protein A3E64_01020 [Candidatus Harrisonbacteria bacterium RIFCSPHIGHO2_12_FULL_48_16]|uniref:DUF5667 domain-containing protein n=1 Tax=Candidatus Harrisonbacteria bacterium RIFCSPHIGHO2_12_FULL_48_16 TaxID=1798405 RepID=A0A1G1ZGK2_9BACT|nr:MAG: hypothetical protein A3E64_01020 [Candidatus Harrisonbacteria bacterium RIFCSPHIGHO2_12_FULL_48_16]
MKRIKPLHVALVFAAAAMVLILRYVVFPPKFLPWEFTEARLKGADIAQRIVELSRGTLTRLNDVSRYDQDRNYNEALVSIARAVIENRQNQVEAVRLSSQLEDMARYIMKISPSRARSLATDAVSSEIALVTRMVYYNDYLFQLFEALKAKLENPSRSYLDGQVNELINNINDEAQSINDLNKHFNQVMAEFDAIFGK